MSFEESTHICKTVKKYALCSGAEPCEIVNPEKEGKQFRGRCGAGFFVIWVPVKGKEREMNA